MKLGGNMKRPDIESIKRCIVLSPVSLCFDIPMSEIEKLCEYTKDLECKYRDLRNEHCLQCGRYRQAHEGLCDGCKWKE